MVAATPAASLVLLENNESWRFSNISLKSLFNSLSDVWGKIVGQHHQMLIAKFSIMFPSA
jgi:hypothetical protein